MPLLSDLQEFKGLWTRRTLEENPSRLSDLENLRTTPEGHLRIRAGVKKPIAIGGTWGASNSPLLTGSATSMVTGGHDLRSPWPVILRQTAAGVFSEDLSQQAFLALFTAAASGERFWIVSPGGKFSTVILNIGRAAANLTLTWKYQATGAGLTALPGVSEQFSSTGEKIIRFSPPTSPTWGGLFYKGYFGFAICAEITGVGGGPVIPRTAQKRITGDFPGRRTPILGISDTQSSATSAKLKRFARDDASSDTKPALVDDGGGSGLDAGYDAPTRYASHDGALYWTNGFVQRRFQGDPALNGALGFTKPAAAGSNLANGAAGNLTGIFLYALAYGYGPNGAWGKSSPMVIAGPVGGAINPTAQQVTVTFPTEVSSLNSGIVDVIYIYRSWDLTGASSATYNNQPLYQIAAVSRQDSDGLFPATYSDNDASWPAPLEQMDSRDRTPPVRCRHLCFHKNRLILANSREHPARVWPSLPGEYEAFDTLTGNGHQDFTSGGGDEVTSVVDYNDMVVVFTNKSMHGIVNLDTEDWSPITIHPELGCVAPDSVRVAYGRLFWLAQQGPYMWDGVNEPEYLGWPVRIESLSSFIHGRSRAVCYDYGYELELIPWDRGIYPYDTQWPSTLYGSLFTKYHYSLRTKEWSKTVFSNSEKSYMQPICTIEWPHYTDYEGRPCPVYARHRVGDAVTDLRFWFGEATNQDDGTAMTWLLEVPYGPWKSGLIVPERWEVDADGMGSVATTISNATTMGEKPVMQGTPGADASSAMTSYQSGFTTPGTGAAVLNLKATGTLTGAERSGYVYGAFLYGRKFQRKQPL